MIPKLFSSAACRSGNLRILKKSCQSGSGRDNPYIKQHVTLYGQQLMARLARNLSGNTDWVYTNGAADGDRQV